MPQVRILSLRPKWRFDLDSHDEKLAFASFFRALSSKFFKVIPWMTFRISHMVQDLGSINNLIPGWNAIITVQNIIQCNYTMQNIAISCGVNILFSVLCIVVISRLFEKESILNG